jgi:hypothetical protein
MYENGLGVEKDYHIAKRLYDQCLQTNPSGFIPVNLILVRLFFKMAGKWISDRLKFKSFAFFTQKPTETPKAEEAFAYTAEKDDLPPEAEVITKGKLILVLALLAGVLMLGRIHVANQDEPVLEEEPLMMNAREIASEIAEKGDSLRERRLYRNEPEEE